MSRQPSAPPAPASPSTPPLSASSPQLPAPLFSVATEGLLQPYLSREWLLTNGLGAFASSSVVGCNTRRYHGLLCAATMPPVGRVIALSRVGEVLYLDGKTDRGLEFSVNQFGINPTTFHPRGDQFLRRFELGDFARWTYDVEGVTVEKELQLLWQKNVIALRYTFDASASTDAGARPGGPPRKLRLELLPFLALRDFHGLRRAGANMDVQSRGRGIRVADGNLALYVVCDAGTFVAQPDWWYGHTYPIEADRGMDCSEDLFCPGRFVIDWDGSNDGDGKRSVTLWASMDEIESGDWAAELRRLAGRRAHPGPKASLFQPKPTSRTTTAAEGLVPASPPAVLPRLYRAAEDFLVGRKSPDGSVGTSVLAGYPWFADWGRDTFISLPGLMLTTGRFEQARQVLSLFGQYVSEGMIPNRFDDYSNETHYNTVDASLWYVHAAFEYLRTSEDVATFDQKLLPACRQIIAGYRDGTRYHIKMQADGLVTQGDASTQLTWMDAKAGDHAFTPRQGKAVEINALWYHVLVLMGEKELAARVADSFSKVFWLGPSRGLADVVDGVDGSRKDERIRPNQIFAASLPNSPLADEQRSAVVEVVRRELLTPYGLRTLARDDPGYRPRYAGPQWQRHASYHNGMVWPWLIGPFLSAYLSVNNRSPRSVEQARQWLQPLIDHMEQNCIGQIAEIFEGDEPHRPVGCPAQAWSVAEVLRMAVELARPATGP